MVFTEGSCTLYVPREVAFHKQQPAYIKYGVFSVGARDWEIHVYPDGAGTLSLHLCLLSATATQVQRTQIWTNPDHADKEIGSAVHRPNDPKEIHSFTVPPSDKNTSISIKVVLTVSATDNQWNPNSVYISFGASSGNTPDQWNPNNADTSFDAGSGKPFSVSPDPPAQWNPGTGTASFDTSPPTTAWDPSSADFSFDNAKSS